jgi:hypothetical protein
MARLPVEVIRALRGNLKVLGQIGCQFFMCPGPDKPFRSMCTCAVCDQIKKTRKVLQNCGVPVEAPSGEMVPR